MSTETTRLIESSLRGDRQAFGRIVERYQNLVSGMTYSMTGDMSASEDLAQDTFVLAWRKLGQLEKRDSLAPWLCGIARNLSRSWLRRQSKATTVPLDEVPAEPAESMEDLETEDRRSEAVWAALSQMDALYREPLVLYYRQERSVRDIAKALELTEDCVKQRLSRGRKMLREEVARMVEDTLEETRPGKAFTAGVLAALPTLPVTGAPGPGGHTASLAQTAGVVGWIAGHKLLAALSILVMVLGGVWGAHQLLSQGEAEGFKGIKVPPDVVTAAQPASEPGDNFGGAESGTEGIDESFSGANEGADGSSASVEGVVVYRDTGKPASGMRVVLGTESDLLDEAVTGDDGRFHLQGLPSGKYAMMAYDVRYEETPEDWLRSEPAELDLSEGGRHTGVRIEVPPQGGEIAGKVYDKQTKEPLRGIRVYASKAGEHTYSATTLADGTYCVLAVPEGEWRVQVFGEGILAAKGEQVVYVKTGEATHFDVDLDRGAPISGLVQDQEGRPVSDVVVIADLMRGGQRRSFAGYLKSGEDGTFVACGACPGDMAVFRARRDNLRSHVAVLDSVQRDGGNSVVITLLPGRKVSGRFVDEFGEPVEATLNHRSAIGKTQASWWVESGDASATFEVFLPEGSHEIKGLPEDLPRNTLQPVKQIEVGPEPLSEIEVPVITKKETAGNYNLQGVVVSEDGQPLARTRVFLAGRDDTNFSYFRETRTDEHGRFSFPGLADSLYGVEATPGEPFEESSFDNINPRHTSDVKLVVRKMASFQGRASDAQSGRPLTEFSVEIGGINEHFGTPIPGKKAKISSNDGRFSLPIRLDDNWYVRVSAERYKPATEFGGGARPGETIGPVEFRLEPGLVVSGVVRDEGGEALGGAYVGGEFFNDVNEAQRKAITVTGSDGRFEIGSVPDDMSTLYVWKEGYAVTEVPVEDSLVVTLRTGGVVEGMVQVEGPVIPARMTVVTLPVDFQGSAWTPVDDDGAYRHESLRPGRYRLMASLRDEAGNALGQYYLDEVVEVADGLTTKLDITVALGIGHIDGLTLEREQPSGPYSLNCRMGAFSLVVRSDESGRYSFENLPAGHGEISILEPSPAGGTRSESRTLFEFTLAPGEHLQQDLEIAEEE